MNPTKKEAHTSRYNTQEPSVVTPVVALDRQVIAVAPKADLIPHASQFTLSILNPVSPLTFYNEKQMAAEDLCDLLQQGKKVSDISYIMVRMPVKGTAALTDAESAALITTRTQGGWRPSSYQDEDDYIWLFSPMNTVKIPQFRALSILFDQIISYEAVGISQLEVTLYLEETLQFFFSIEKLCQPPCIAQFYPSPHSVAAGQNTTLFWNAYDFNSGNVSPLAFSFHGDVSSYTWQPAASMCVRLFVFQHGQLFPAKADSAAVKDCCKTAPVYVRPPQFRQLKLEGSKTSRKVIWDAVFASAITCDGETIKAKDEKQLPPEKTKICFHAEGYLFQREETLYFPDHEELILLQKTELQFQAFTVLQLRWEFQTITQVRLKVSISNDDRQVLFLDPIDTWEYPVQGYQSIQLEAIKERQVLFSILL